MPKNTCLKERPVDNPYEVWVSFDGSWTWKVLKKWQADDSKEFARWFCHVTSPFVPNGELGDVYVAEIKAHLSAYLKETEKGPVVGTKNGKPVALILGVTDEEEIERLMAYSPKFQALLARGRQQIQETGGVAHEQFWQEMETETE